MMRSPFFPLACLALVAGLLAACGNRRSEEDLRGTLVYGFGDNFKTFDTAYQVYAQEAGLIAQVLEPLARWTHDLEIEPYLATSWETPDDCSTWVFYLREGVTFHDGTPFTSEAVKFHFERILDPATASTRRKRVEEVDRIETPEPHRVIFHLKQANCVFPERMAETFAHIPSPTAVQKFGNDAFGRNPVGTGPFKFVEWEPDVRIVLEKYEDHWRSEDFPLERVIFRPVRENTTRLILLEQGVLDAADISFAHVNIAKETEDIIVQSTPHLSIRYIGFNTQKPPFDNKLVRQAANYAVNKEDIVKYLFFGVGEPATGPIPQLLPDYNPDIRIYDYDPEKARELLAEAGYPDGFSATLWTTESGAYRIVGDKVVEDLRLIGINIEMNILDNAVYWDKFDEYLPPVGEPSPTKAGVYDVYLGGWVGGEAAHGYLEPLFKSRSYSNSSFFMHEEVDALLNQYKTKRDPLERRDIFHRLQEIIVEEAPWVFAYHGQLNTGLRKRVKNFRINASGRYFLDHVYVTMPGEEGGDEHPDVAEAQP